MRHGVLAGLEIFFIDAGGVKLATGPSVFFTFGSELERDDVAAVIADQPSIGATLPGGRAAASACGSILEVQTHTSCTQVQLEVFTSNRCLLCFTLLLPLVRFDVMRSTKGAETRPQHRGG